MFDFFNILPPEHDEEEYKKGSWPEIIIVMVLVVIAIGGMILL